MSRTPSVSGSATRTSSGTPVRSPRRTRSARSLVSQQLLGTREIVVDRAHAMRPRRRGRGRHQRARIADTTGFETEMAFGAFADLEAMVREQVEILRDEPVLLEVPVRATGSRRAMSLKPSCLIS